MKCENIEPKLTAYVLDELDTSERELVEEHLKKMQKLYRRS